MKNNYYLGIDTSNYTTSLCLLSDDGAIINSRKLLEVRQGERGLRQNDCVFLHTKQLPGLFKEVYRDNIQCIAVSEKPENRDSSYMPCFTVGVSFAEVLSAALKCPLYKFSHQQGHIAAGLLKNTNLINKPFYAFHLSGGTMKLLKVEDIYNIKNIGSSLDITAGQLIDRVGVKLGFSFPAGKEVEISAESGKLNKEPKITVKDGCCCLSGFENKAEEFLRKGININDICRYIQEAVLKSIEQMADCAVENYGPLPFLFVGGVMSNKFFRENLSDKFEAVFASPELSCDNAAGTSFLGKLKFNNLI